LLSTTFAADDASKGPLKVFVLAGQSNMEGAGTIALDPKRNDGKGSLEYLVKDPATAKRFKHLMDSDGKWAVRNDVWIWYLGRGYKIVGFGWHQGWNDRVNQAANDAYEQNMANFIRDARKELGIEKLPFVIAETGMSGHSETHPRALSLMRAQAAVAEHDEFRGNVAFVGTKDFYRPAEVSPSRQAYHWNSNAETYYLIGAAMGEAMKKLRE